MDCSCPWGKRWDWVVITGKSVARTQARSVFMLRSAFSLQISGDAHAQRETLRLRERLCIERGNSSACIFTGSAQEALTCSQAYVHILLRPSTGQEKRQYPAPAQVQLNSSSWILWSFSLHWLLAGRCSTVLSLMFDALWIPHHYLEFI